MERYQPVTESSGSLCAINRRAMLKSAATLIGASAFSMGGSGSGFGQNTGSAASSRSGNSGTANFTDRMMGFMLPHEQFPVPQLVEFGEAAERAGFDLLATSDHFQPWQSNEGHSSEAWVTMAALGERTRRVWMGSTVTCPTF